MKITKRQIEDAEKGAREHYINIIMNDPTEAELEEHRLSASLMESTIGLVQKTQEDEAIEVLDDWLIKGKYNDN